MILIHQLNGYINEPIVLLIATGYQVRYGWVSVLVEEVIEHYPFESDSYLAGSRLLKNHQRELLHIQMSHHLLACIFKGDLQRVHFEGEL